MKIKAMNTGWEDKVNPPLSQLCLNLSSCQVDTFLPMGCHSFLDLVLRTLEIDISM